MGSTNSVCVLVGYSGFYGLFPYCGQLCLPVCQHGCACCAICLSRTLLKSSYDHAPVLAFVLLTVSLSTCADIKQLYGEYKLLAGHKSIPPPFNTSSKLLLSNTLLPPNTALVSPRKRPSTPMDLGLITLVAWVM